jgi:hypothetical protein
LGGWGCHSNKNKFFVNGWTIMFIICDTNFVLGAFIALCESFIFESILVFIDIEYNEHQKSKRNSEGA